ncbi:MAG: hypothetical protein IT379_42085 [Deltaproteobacteria bacterium]|nr:hypothetical protein [Deltaproteobacteria bacterium]
MESVLDANQWAIVPSVSPMLERPDDRVAVVRALATRGLRSLEEVREHPTVWLVRSTLLALLPATDRAAAAIRDVDARGTWGASNEALDLELTDRLVRVLVPALIEQRDDGSARALRALAPVRDARSAERARSVLERALPAARVDREARAVETAIRALERIIRQSIVSPRFRDPYFVEAIAGNVDPDDPTFGLLQWIPRERLARLGPSLLRALVDNARRHPLPPPPPPPPLPWRRPSSSARPWPNP